MRLPTAHHDTRLQGVIVLLLCLVQACLPQKHQCHNYKLWDDPYAGRGVKRLEFGCRSGSIEWNGPYGGLLVQIQPPANTEEPQQLCLQVRSVHTAVSVSVTTDKSSDPQKLLTLNETKEDEKSPTSTHCFHVFESTELFAEPDVGAPTSSRILIDYYIDNLPAENDKVCSPCTDKELLHYYCSSDFVAIGSMLDVKTTAASNIIPVSLDLMKQQSIKYFSKDSTQTTKYIGNIYSPAQCKMKYGAGKFVFMGKMKFGKAELRCAPTYEDFLELQVKSRLTGALLCR